MAFEDQLLFNVRLDLRQLRVLGNNYQRVQKRQIELAYMQVDQAFEQFNQPQAPPVRRHTGSCWSGGGSAGRRSGRSHQQLLTTQASLLRSQNDLYNTWITYLIDRMDIYRDMGVMPLDNRGVWIDDNATSLNASDNRQPASQQRPAGLPNEPPPLVPNGSPIPVPSRLPKARRWSRGSKGLIALLVLLVAGGVSFGGWYFLRHNNANRPDLILHTVKKEKLLITITERGNLESAINNELSCGVKAKTPTAPATSIRWVIDNGSIVNKGDRLMDLDDSTLQDQKNDQEIKVVAALGVLRQAEQQYLIDVSTADGLIKTATTGVEVAQIALQEYLEGLFQQQAIDADNKVIMATSDLAMWEELAPPGPIACPGPDASMSPPRRRKPTRPACSVPASP